MYVNAGMDISLTVLEEDMLVELRSDHKAKLGSE